MQIRTLFLVNNVLFYTKKDVYNECRIKGEVRDMGKYYLAIDIGASSGRHIIAEIVDGKIVLEEVYRMNVWLGDTNRILQGATKEITLEGVRCYYDEVTGEIRCDIMDISECNFTVTSLNEEMIVVSCRSSIASTIEVLNQASLKIPSVNAPLSNGPVNITPLVDKERTLHSTGSPTAFIGVR